jgi:RNA polymerase sigma-70 factor (ECF subfamily)
MKQEHVPAIQLDAEARSPNPSGEAAAAPTPAERIAELFSEHANFVWRSLRGLGVPEADAEDAAQPRAPLGRSRSWTIRAR